MLCTPSISAVSILHKESQLWLKEIYKRMSGRVSIKPHYGEIHHSIPYVIVKSMTRILNAVDDFREPFCYLAKKQKG